MKNRIKQFIFNHRLYHALINFLKRIKFHEGRISLYDIIVVFIAKVRNDEIIERANGVAFSFTLAIFPAIIFLFTLIPILDPIPDMQDKVMDFLESVLPPSMYDVVASTILDIISRPRGGLLSFGFVFALFLATNGMMTLMRAFNSVYSTVDTRGFFKARLIATGLTVMLAMVFILAILLLIGGQVAIAMITELGHLDGNFTIFLILLTRMVVMFIVFLIAISFIYYFAPAIHLKWNFFSIGALFSTVLCLALSYGFSFYITNFGTYNKFYGSIGVMIAIMIWFFLLSVVMLVGYEINASVHSTTVEIREEKLMQAEAAENGKDAPTST